MPTFLFTLMLLFIRQCWRRHRQQIPRQRHRQPRRRLQMDASWNLRFLVFYRHQVVSLWRTKVQTEVWLLDLRWHPYQPNECRGCHEHRRISGKWRVGSPRLVVKFHPFHCRWWPLKCFLASGVPAKLTYFFYECCPDNPYIDISYYLHIRRRYLYYGSNLIIPCALISSLSVFTFGLPPDTNAKVSLGKKSLKGHLLMGFFTKKSYL